MTVFYRDGVGTMESIDKVAKERKELFAPGCGEAAPQQTRVAVCVSVAASFPLFFETWTITVWTNGSQPEPGPA